MKTEYLVTVRSLDGKPSTGQPSEILVTISDLFRECLRRGGHFGIGPTGSITAKQAGWEVTVSPYYPPEKEQDIDTGYGY